MTFKKNKNAWQSMNKLDIESFSILRIIEVNEKLMTPCKKLWANVCLDVGAYARPKKVKDKEIENLDVWNEDNI